MEVVRTRWREEALAIAVAAQAIIVIFISIYHRHCFMVIVICIVWMQRYHMMMAMQVAERASEADLHRRCLFCQEILPGDHELFHICYCQSSVLLFKCVP